MGDKKGMGIIKKQRYKPYIAVRVKNISLFGIFIM